MQTAHDVALALAVAAILFFTLGFCAITFLLLAALAPPITQAPMPPETVVQYLLGIAIFEAMSALPCAIISFAVEMQ